MIALCSAVALAGALEGRVVDDAGVGAPNAVVVAYDRRLGFANVTTGADGGFRFPSLPDGPYRVRVIPYAESELVEEWAHDTLGVCASAVFDVDVEGPAPFVEVALGVGASLRGVVVDLEGEPVVGALVSARAVDAPAAFLRADVTDATGAFVVRGLPTWDAARTTYRLEVDADGWPVQQLGGGYLASEALAVEVVRGVEQDIGSYSLRDGISVAGTATGPLGEPVTGEVRVYSGAQVVETDVVDGVWAVTGLPPGQVLPWVRAPGYGTTWWPDADRPGERLPILEEGGARDDVDIDLPTQSRLPGRLLGATSTGNIAVLAYNDDQTVGVGAVANDQGEFVVERLHAGSYTLFVFGSGGGFLDDFARGTNGALLAFAVPHQADAPVADIFPQPGAALSGTVRDRVTGEPVYGASVRAEGQQTASSRVVTTNRDGEWSLPGLKADAWAVWVEYEPYCAADPGWAPIHHPDRVNPALVEVIVLAPGDAVTWDAMLPPDHDHDGMDDGWEEEHGLDPTRDDSFEDADGDGFANIEEYVLGTDPSGRALADGGCGCTGRSAVMWPLALVPWWRRRRVG